MAAHFLEIKLRTCVFFLFFFFLSKHLGSFQNTRFTTLSKMIKKAPADSGDRELPRALKGDAGGGGLNSGHLPPKTSVILDH